MAGGKKSEVPREVCQIIINTLIYYVIFGLRKTRGLCFDENIKAGVIPRKSDCACPPPVAPQD